MEDSLRGALQALYCRHYNDVTSLSCYLERQLPLREPFYQLKRVPHFQVRDDLHHCDAPAYTPILRLESATPEDVSQRGRAGCRRVLVEGDLGTGKTFLCYNLLQQWATPRAKPLPLPLSKSPRLHDISTFKVVVYLDCVRLAVADFLTKLSQQGGGDLVPVKRHVHVVACALMELLAPNPNDGRCLLDRLYQWVSSHQSDVCLIFDNVDASETWLQLIEDTLKETEGGGWGKVVVCATPGRLPKRHIDSLFYCYGLHPDYSVKLVASKLKKVSAEAAERAEALKTLDSSQELLRNPLTQSLLATFLKQLRPGQPTPETQFDLIEEMVSSAMVGDSYPVTAAAPGKPAGVVRLGGRGSSAAFSRSLSSPSTPSSSSSSSSSSCPGLVVSPTSLMSICETVAFECLETNTNYFCKFKFPAHFWTKHLCDCRILHEVHDIVMQGRPVVSFTSRCIRDYLASKRVCRYLLSDRDSNHFLDVLIHKKQFHSVVKFCIRHFVKLNRLDMVQLLLERLLAVKPKRFIKAYKQAEAFSRGRLSEHKEVLAWLRETDFNADLLRMVAAHFPAILEVAYNECPPEALRDFCSVAERAGQELSIQGAVVYMDGMFLNPALGLELARCLGGIRSLTTLVVCLRCVVDTGFVVHFLCRLFEGNSTVKNLTLEGPFNSAENLTPALHRRVKQVFCAADDNANNNNNNNNASSSNTSNNNTSNDNDNNDNDKTTKTTGGVALQNVSVEHVHYHHRVAYVLSCWPPLFQRLELRKSNLDHVAPQLNHKLTTCRGLTALTIDHCHVLPATLDAVLDHLGQLQGSVVLKTLTLSLLSSARHFTRSDARKVGFKPSLTLSGCGLLARFVAGCATLQELTLCHDGVDDVKAKVLVEAVSQSRSLTSVDLTGNVIGDEACDDVIGGLLSLSAQGGRALKALYVHENSFSAEVRRALIKSCVDRRDFQLSV